MLTKMNKMYYQPNSSKKPAKIAEPNEGPTIVLEYFLRYFHNLSLQLRGCKL